MVLDAVFIIPGVDPLAAFPPDYEPDVDLFAGGGGASTGFEEAFGKSPDIAINHDLEALTMHRANHPESLHICQNVINVQPLMATGGRLVRALWASPDCKHFSKAKGGKPRDQNIRDLAWTVVKWAEQTRPKLIGLENVEEFQTWGPLDTNGKPIKSRAGETFREWVRALRKLGYSVAWRELVASDYGAPTTRKRLFVIARLDGQRIKWPKPTHGKPDSAAVKAGRLLPWRTAADCINWADPAPSIFERKRPLAYNTQRRIAEGIRRYVLKSAKPFIVTYYGAKTAIDFRGQDMAEPLRTQTTENRHALIGATLIQTGYGERQGQSPRVPGLEKPLGTVVGTGKHALTTANLIVKNYTGVVGHGPDQPLGTVTGIDHHSLVAASLIKYYRDGGQHASLSEPAPTSTTRARFGLQTAVLHQYNGASAAQPLDDPMPTVTTRDRLAITAATICQENKHGLVSCPLGQGDHYEEVKAFLRSFGIIGPADEAEVVIDGVTLRITDIGLRMLRPRELFTTNGFPPTYTIAPEYNGKPLTITSQVRKCGNSVPPPFVTAVFRANKNALDYVRTPFRGKPLPLLESMEAAVCV